MSTSTESEFPSKKWAKTTADKFEEGNAWSTATQHPSLQSEEDSDQQLSFAYRPTPEETLSGILWRIDQMNQSRPPVQRHDPKACLFVASLSSSRTEEHLHKSVTHHFEQWGPVAHVKVMTDCANRPYAFVQFVNVDDAQRAMMEAHDTVLDGRHIRIERAKVNRTIFLAKFAKAFSKDDMMRILEKFGPIEDLVVLENLQTGESKGCGFVRFRFRDDAIYAFSCLRSQTSWVIEWAANLDPETIQLDHHSIFVGQLNSGSITKEMLRKRFEKYGNVVSVQLINRHPESNDPAKTAFAFIQYGTAESAKKAVESENGKEWLDRKIRVQLREMPESRMQRTLSAPATFNRVPTNGSSSTNGYPFAASQQFPPSPMPYPTPFMPFMPPMIMMTPPPSPANDQKTRQPTPTPASYFPYIPSNYPPTTTPAAFADTQPSHVPLSPPRSMETAPHPSAPPPPSMYPMWSPYAPNMTMPPLAMPTSIPNHVPDTEEYHMMRMHQEQMAIYHQLCAAAALQNPYPPHSTYPYPQHHLEPSQRADHPHQIYPPTKMTIEAQPLGEPQVAEMARQLNEKLGLL